MSGKTSGHRPRVRLKCGEDRFPKSKLYKLKQDLATQARMQKEKSTTCNLATDQETYGYSPKVLIHGWQKRLMQVKPVTKNTID